MTDISCRPFCRNDLGYIIETLCKKSWPHGFAWSDWRYAYGHLVERMLDEGRCLVLECDGVLLGFALERNGHISAVHVKFQNRGLGPRLLHEMELIGVRGWC